MGDLDEAPALQLLQAGADLAARHRNGVGDLLGAQRAPRLQQRVDLRYGHGEACAPARSQFAPVQDDFSVTDERFMSKPDDRYWGTFETSRDVRSVVANVAKADLTRPSLNLRKC